MFELAATFALALIYAIIIGVRKGAHKEGIHGMNVESQWPKRLAIPGLKFYRMTKGL